ncbi:MAG: type II secretion system GspH family protein [Opitutaceae bacterium]|jgi:general secretion pathway protein G|nr:type II secretion system GspH family protein [Opitutaceae bacterium]
MNPRPPPPPAPPASAFTLVELLAVIVIIGVLAALLLPVVGRVRKAAKAAECISNHRQLAAAFAAYAADNKGWYPSPGWNAAATNSNLKGGSWVVEIADYCGRDLGTRDDARTGFNADEKIRQAERFAWCPEYATRKNNHNCRGIGMFSINENLYTERCPPDKITNPARHGLVSDSEHLGAWGGKSEEDGKDLSRDVVFALLAERHGGKLHVGFIDGHVRSFTSTTKEIAAQFANQYGGNGRMKNY